ncbi:MAG: hypothetical protein FJZ56_00485 [Chlamydiae bacterium]|nr:hypothetical protein [Chlamydiota bacterium]
MQKSIRVALIGATGKLGSKIVLKLLESSTISLEHAIVRPKSPLIGKPLSTFFPSCPLPLLFHANYEKMCRDSDVIIDVSHPDALSRYIPHVLRSEKALIIGATGYQSSTEKLVEEISTHIPILRAPNFSLGIPFLAKFMQICEEAFHKNAKVTIEEWHHKNKKDAPSGTALFLASKLKTSPELISHREDEIVGVHKICFESASEVIELTHKALSRDLYAEGAIKAIEFLHQKPKGLYQMADLLAIM